MGERLLLGREGELARISNAVEEDTGRVVLITGPAGIGKSALLEAGLADAAAAGCTIVRGRGFEMERGFAFGVARQLVNGLTPPEKGAARLALSLFGPDAAAAASVESVVYGTYWLLSPLAEAVRIVVAVDDAQWADEESRLLLHYLAARVSELGLLLLMTVRSGEPGADELMQLAHDPSAETIRPDPLGIDAIDTLVRSQFGEADPEFVEACLGATGGNPLLLRELLLSLQAEGAHATTEAVPRLAGVTSEVVTQNVLARISQLGKPARDLSVAIAVLGGGCELAEAADLAGHTLEESGIACDALAQVDILAPGVPLEFAHPLLRGVVYQDIGAARRRALHTGAAEVLLRRGAAPERIAAQLLEGEPVGTEEASAALEAAAASALRNGASKRAATYLDCALREPQPNRGGILAKLGRLRAAEFSPDALELLEEAARIVSEPELMTEVLLDQARALVLQGRTEAAIALLGDAGRDPGGASSEPALLMDAELIALGQMDVLPSAVFSDRLAGYAKATPKGETPGECAILGTLAFEAFRTIEPREKCAQLGARAMNGGHLESLPPATPVRIVTGLALRQSEEVELAGRLAASAIAQAQALGSDLAFAIATFDLANTARWRGDLEAAEEHCSVVLATAGPEGHQLGPYAGSFWAVVALDTAGPARAREILAETKILDQPADEIVFNEVLYYRGCVAAACGRLDEAIADLAACGERELAHGHRNPAGTPWRTALALASLQARDREGAAAECATELELARRFGAPRMLGIALRTQGLIRGGEEGLESLASAIEALELSPDRLELARALIDYGAALRRAKRRADSRAPLTEGTDLAARCGARVLAERGTTELRALGARPRRHQVWGLEALTPSERRVARMAAGGMSNPEIAQALFVSRKTVETHLGSVYSKLDLRGRGGLAAALGEAGP